MKIALYTIGLFAIVACIVIGFANGEDANEQTPLSDVVTVPLTMDEDTVMSVEIGSYIDDNVINIELVTENGVHASISDDIMRISADADFSGSAYVTMYVTYPYDWGPPADDETPASIVEVVEETRFEVNVTDQPDISIDVKDPVTFDLEDVFPYGWDDMYIDSIDGARLEVVGDELIVDSKGQTPGEYFFNVTAVYTTTNAAPGIPIPSIQTLTFDLEISDHPEQRIKK